MGVVVFGQFDDGGRTNVRLSEETRLSAGDPTSGFSVLNCSKFSVVASFSTSPSRLLECRCCIDRLRSQRLSGHSNGSSGAIVRKHPFMCRVVSAGHIMSAFTDSGWTIVTTERSRL